MGAGIAICDKEGLTSCVSVLSEFMLKSMSALEISGSKPARAETGDLPRYEKDADQKSHAILVLPVDPDFD